VNYCFRDKNVIANIVCRDQSPAYSYCIIPPPDSRARNNLGTKEDQERARTSNNLAAFDALPDMRSTKKKYLKRRSNKEIKMNGSSSSLQSDECSIEEIRQLLNELKIFKQNLAKGLVQMKLREDKMKKVTFGQEVDKTSEVVQRRTSDLVSILRNGSGAIPRSFSK